MKKLNIFPIMLILFSFIAFAAVSHILNAPADFTETTSSSTLFNWTPVTDNDLITESQLYLDGVLNVTVACDNSTSIISTNASVTGSTTAPWNTSTNFTLNITYTNNTITEGCIVILTQNATLNITEAMANITSACNLTAVNSSNSIKLATSGTGSDENITFNSGGNATGILGFTLGTTYGLDPVFCDTTVTGMNPGFYQWYIQSRDNALNATVTGMQTPPFNTTTNYSLNIRYTVAGSIENCEVLFTQNESYSVVEAAANVSVACNITAKNSSNSLNLTTYNKGSDEFINITGGNATNIFGFSLGVTTGSETFSSSVQRWLEVRAAVNVSRFEWTNESGFVAMFLDKDIGNLFVAGDFNSTFYNGNSTWQHQVYPPACSASFGVSEVGDSNVCTHFMLGTGDRVTGNYDINGTINSTHYYINGSLGLSGNFSNGNCWNKYLGGIPIATNCTAV